MNYSNLQKTIKEVCDSNKLIISDEVSEDSYVASIMDSSNDKNNILNLKVSDNKIESYVTTSDGNDIEKFTKDGDFNEDEGLEFIFDSIDSFQILSGVSPDDTDEDGNPIINEDNEVGDKFSGVVDGLTKIKFDIKKAADNLRSISELSEDPEVVSIIMDLANNGYSFVLDVESAIYSYNEIMEIQDEEDTDTEEVEESKDNLNETRQRIKIAESIMAMRSLKNSGIVSNSGLKAYEDLLDELLS